MEERSYGKPFNRSGKPHKGRKPYGSKNNARGNSYGTKNNSSGEHSHRNNEGEQERSYTPLRRGNAKRSYGTPRGRNNGRFTANDRDEQQSPIGKDAHSSNDARGNGSKYRSRNQNSNINYRKGKTTRFTNRDDSASTPHDRSVDREELRKSHYSKKKQLEHQLKQPPKAGLLRLNKFIANTGVCSRREADEYIRQGKITINGKVVSEVGTKVNLKDDVRLDGKRLNPEAKVYLVLNKPKDFVTTMDDPLGRKTVMNLIGNACKERIYPVGRLDRMTTGVLLFTNDGELTKKLTHPKYNKKKIYHVFLDKPLTKFDLEKISQGLDLEDGFIQADAISYVSQEDKNQVGIEIHSGKNRIVRRIFEHLGYKVDKLDRVFFAGITKKNLPRGRWRFLSPDEVKMLKTY